MFKILPFRKWLSKCKTAYIIALHGKLKHRNWQKNCLELDWFFCHMWSHQAKPISLVYIYLWFKDTCLYGICHLVALWLCRFTPLSIIPTQQVQSGLSWVKRDVESNGTYHIMQIKTRTWSPEVLVPRTSETWMGYLTFKLSVMWEKIGVWEAFFSTLFSFIIKRTKMLWRCA